MNNIYCRNKTHRVMKKPLPPHLAAVFVYTAVSLCTGCPISPKQEAPDAAEKAYRVTLATWNVQTFFDAVTEGTEYREFKDPSSSWSEQKYTERLERLCGVISTLNADIIALQEIEHSGIIHDIVNYLPAQADRTKAYRYACFAKEPGSVFGNAVLSRYPLERFSVHHLDIRTGLSQPYLRPVMKMDICRQQAHRSARTGGTSAGTNRLFTLYVCHWKSKSGGETISAVWQAQQEQLLASLLSDESAHGNRFAVCGDFNRDISEFTVLSAPEVQPEQATENGTSGNIPNILLTGGTATDGSSIAIPVYSPWINSADAGSYFYKDKWEKIDHFFSGNGVRLSDFKTANTGVLVRPDGTPYRYAVYNGKGYSDHLPLSAALHTAPY